MTSMPLCRLEVTCDDDQASSEDQMVAASNTEQVSPVPNTKVLSLAEVEDWLDDHRDNAADYFLREMDIKFIDRWLMTHGFFSTREYIASRRNSNTPNDSDEHLLVDQTSGYFSDGPQLTTRPRLKSKKFLRQNFARSKRKNALRESEPISQSTDSPTHARRHSFRDFRRYLSLPSRSSHILNHLIESKVRIPRVPSKGVEAKRELRFTNERQFFLEIVQEIAHDLDAKSLTWKIITNLAVLVDSDCASLYLIEGPKDKRMLVSKVFDVHCGTDIFLPGSGKDDEIKVPWGTGIIGHVANTGMTVNLINPNQDPRYNDEVDKIRGYRTDTLLCMPIRNADDEIIGVAQAVNKNLQSGEQQFTEEDEKLARAYLEFCGIALTNARLFEMSQKEYERNRSLLEVAHDLFEEQTSLEKVILKIMQRAQQLLKCEKAAVLLLQEGSESENVKFSRTFELTSSPLAPFSPVISSAEPETSLGLLRFAKRVVATGEVLNITDPKKISGESGRHIRSLLCMPIRERDYKIIGVATIINRLDGLVFDENDEQLFKAFTLFCGLGINNTLMYSELEKAMARQKVAIEVISYHATATQKDIKQFLSRHLPEAKKLELTSLKFDDFSLTSDEMILASIHMFQDLGLLSHFKIDVSVLCLFLATVRKNYRNIPYHNWRHAFNVAQVMFAILKNCGVKCVLSDLEILGMMVGCLCHDLDHRGTNNAFQQKTGSALALLYGNKATMEQHHFNHAVMILSSEDHNIFATLSRDEYSRVMNILKNAILATDLSTYFQLRGKFFSLVDNTNYEWKKEENREVLKSMLITACDLGASTKPWSIQQRVAKLVTDEFFDQGDKERLQLKIQPQALMDREKIDELPQMQVSWIDAICLPLYKVFSKINSGFIEMVEGAVSNRDKWEALASRKVNLTNGNAEMYDKETGV
ncbi:dual 3',5'-cyclic-AMP and -GMP phosphodiesterase 11A-like isoform X2 [Limulus polyphemus]|uniref:Phosphodiesterase n=1 Tax=Limulus polyphemus TaxID=6850 RepID=A0ABM1T4I3_LIMPO|nr:dual 3',5'-cyclic-AMP and -GMP phosphodiesterase 11A-like isoform X2 [Limulus polyphemus]